MNRIFITGTDTDVGKTWVSGLLLSALPLGVIGSHVKLAPKKCMTVPRSHVPGE